MSELDKLPIGSKFLPKVEITRLQKMQNSETNDKIKLKLSVCIMRKNGTSIRNISDKTNLPYTTINDWLTLIHNNGIKSLYKKNSHGPQCKLSIEQLKELKEELKAGPRHCGFESNIWTSKLITVHIQRRYGVRYTIRGAHNLIDRIGFSCSLYKQLNT